MNTGCKNIVFLNEYAGAEDSMLLWVQNSPGRVWWHYGH
jgi:hypothetical protein